jgi:hypothetical protein
MTWVLIVLVTGLYKGGPATVPGYTTKEFCQQAGQAFLSERIEGNRHITPSGFICIPGPARSAPAVTSDERNNV